MAELGKLDLDAIVKDAIAAGRKALEAAGHKAEPEHSAAVLSSPEKQAPVSTAAVVEQLMALAGKATKTQAEKILRTQAEAEGVDVDNERDYYSFLENVITQLSEKVEGASIEKIDESWRNIKSVSNVKNTYLEFLERSIAAIINKAKPAPSEPVPSVPAEEPVPAALVEENISSAAAPTKSEYDMKRPFSQQPEGPEGFVEPSGGVTESLSSEAVPAPVESPVEQHNGETQTENGELDIKIAQALSRLELLAPQSQQDLSVHELERFYINTKDVKREIQNLGPDDADPHRVDEVSKELDALAGRVLEQLQKATQQDLAIYERDMRTLEEKFAAATHRADAQIIFEAAEVYRVEFEDLWSIARNYCASPEERENLNGIITKCEQKVNEMFAQLAERFTSPEPWTEQQIKEYFVQKHNLVGEMPHAIVFMRPHLFYSLDHLVMSDPRGGWERAASDLKSLWQSERQKVQEERDRMFEKFVITPGAYFEVEYSDPNNPKNYTKHTFIISELPGQPDQRKVAVTEREWNGEASKWGDRTTTEGVLDIQDIQRIALGKIEFKGFDELSTVETQTPSTVPEISAMPEALLRLVDLNREQLDKLESHPDVIDYKEALWESYLPNKARENNLDVHNSEDARMIFEAFNAEWRISRRQLIAEDVNPENWEEFLKQS